MMIVMSNQQQDLVFGTPERQPATGTDDVGNDTSASNFEKPAVAFSPANASPTMMSDNDGHGRTISDHDGQRPTMSSQQKRSDHTFRSHEATRLLEQLGVMRTQRSIERYCKNGNLDCYYDGDLGQYFITRASVERLAGYLKEIQGRKESAAAGSPPTETPTAGDDHVGRGRDATHQRANEADDAELRQLQAHIKELEFANRDLEIASRVKDELLRRAEQDRQHLIDQQGHLIGRIEQRAHQVGALETKLHALEAAKPQEGTTERDSTPTHRVHVVGEEKPESDAMTG